MSQTVIRAKQRQSVIRVDLRPRAATQLEAEIREYWDAASALLRPAFAARDLEHRMSLPIAVAVLTELATTHSSHRLRRAAADRLMSFAPETAAQLMKRRGREKQSQS